MASRLLPLLKNDIKLLIRYGILTVYGFVVAFYVALIIYAGDLMPAWLIALIIITEPTAFGFFFLGGLMQLEKSEDVRSALGVTPVSALEYFFSKAISMSAIALIAVSVLVFFTGNNINWIMLFAIVTLTSVQFLAIGIPAAIYFKTLSGYLIGSITYLMPILLLGIFAFFEPMPVWAILFPTASEFKLILVATGASSASTWEIIAMFIVVFITFLASIQLAVNSLQKELGYK
ncbi:hypothetical protein MNBD_ALPHA12-883 [hydrothermal vent metagenome]|uniref:ABC-2 type transporter domain-containing protein n=1 Tax=hydrothermal vent metagenome TaxID=652676 RepID=A0A3B0TTU3_9ZZZZ